MGTAPSKLSILTVSRRPWTWYALLERVAAVCWHGPIEFVLVEHLPMDGQGSGLRYLTAAKGYEAKFLPVSFSESLATCRTEALHLATGDYVLWMDDDDWSHRHLAQKLVGYLVRDPRLVGCGPVDAWWVTLRGGHVNEFVEASMPIFAASLWRRDEVAFLPFDGNRNGEDTRWMKYLRRDHGKTLGHVRGFLEFIAVSHMDNAANREPPGNRLEGVHAKDLKHGPCAPADGLVAHLERLASGLAAWESSRYLPHSMMVGKPDRAVE